MAFVEVGGVRYDPNIPDEAAALGEMGYWYRNGQWVNVNAVDEYVSQNVPSPIPNEVIATADKGSSLTTNVLGITQNPTPGIMQNVLMAGTWSGFDPSNIAQGLAIIRAYSLEVYGSTELGTVRYSSEVLENEPTGVRPGSMERIVIPAWARRERGSPL